MKSCGVKFDVLPDSCVIAEEIDGVYFFALPISRQMIEVLTDVLCRSTSYYIIPLSTVIYTVLSAYWECTTMAKDGPYFVDI